MAGTPVHTGRHDPFRDRELRSSKSSRPPGVATRHSLGIILLLIVVVLWTTSNFLASTIFADDTYSKPFFVTYFNTSFFVSTLVPIGVRELYRAWKAGKLGQVTSVRTIIDRQREEEARPFLSSQGEAQDANQQFDEQARHRHAENLSDDILGFKATARLSFQFCLLWFSANYFAFACLQFTTVGSTTILTSTSGVWTLVFGAMVGVEKFTVRKLFGVLASLTGIFLISRVDMSGSSDEHRGSFPHKTTGELALGDAMAAFSAILYGAYTIVMKKQVGDESRVDMKLFFGLVGLMNSILLWPGFFILHFTGFETFSLPESKRIWIIILVNALISLISDICWAYSMLLTTPLVVTVGLSLTIPLSLVGQIFIHGQYSSAMYWIGAAIVFFSFIAVNHESKES
ncbi:hypothetical protein VTO42DRAFT_3619 [Malbranchea cinnamomea]